MARALTKPINLTLTSNRFFLYNEIDLSSNTDKMIRFHKKIKPQPSKLFSFILGIVLAGLILTNFNTTQAQGKSFVWEQYDVVITLQPNGELHVEETQTLNFSGEPFTFGFATIPVGSAGNNDGIRNLTVREGDVVYSENRSSQPNTFYTYNDGEEVGITWYFEPALGRRSYTFSYVVDGGVIVGTSTQGDGDQIFWKAIPEDHGAPINSSTVTIILPEGVSPQQYTGTTDYLVAGYANGDDSIVATQVSENGRIITYQLTQPLPADQAFEVRVQFPHGLLNIPVPGWQAQMQQTDTINLIAYSLSFLCLIAGLLFVVFLWYSLGRDPETGFIVPEYVTSPPGNLRPAVVGTLVDERADMRDIVSIIIDLAQRGYLIIAEEKGKDHTFQLTEKDRTHLRPFESRLVKDLFGTKDEKTLSDLKYAFHSKLPNIRKKLYDELVTEKLVDNSPESVRKNYAIIGGFLLAFAVFTFFFMGIIAEEALIFALAFCPAIVLGILAIAFFIVSRHMPRKTVAGVEATQKWLAFKTYLQNIDIYEDLSQTSGIFEQYLPYATAFGLDRSWIHKFAKQTETAVPTWYRPIHPTHASGRRTTSSASSAPSLEGMSDSMSGGLESISSNLTRMLNSTASTLSSTPPSSSSSGSSGSFSSGFSGGSSFSSSGGGSRGFG